MAITINGTDGFSSDNSALKFDTSVFVIDETNNRIGVNTASPSQALDVTGDIEVSGGVYLGGTGSANYLDDYEVGTWTPTFGGSTTDPSGVTYDIQGGRYTKVGNLVTVQFNIGTDAVTNVGSGALYIRGLPFTPNDGFYFRAVAWNFTGSNSTYNSTRPDIGFCYNGTPVMGFWTASTTTIQTSALVNSANTNRLYGVATYLTDS